MAQNVYANTARVVSLPKFNSEAKMVTMILHISTYATSSRHPHLNSPHKLIPPVTYQLDAACSAAPHIKQVATKLDSAELDDDDDERFAQRQTEDLGVEA